MRIPINIIPKGYIQIPQHEYDMLTFKSKSYDNIDSVINVLLEEAHRSTLDGDDSDYTDGVFDTTIRINKELCKDELRKRTGGGKLFPVQTGDSDLSW